MTAEVLFADSDINKMAKTTEKIVFHTLFRAIKTVELAELSSGLNWISKFSSIKYTS